MCGGSFPSLVDSRGRERHELPSRVRGGAAVANAFLACFGSQTGVSRRKNATFSAGTGLEGVEADPPGPPRPKFSATSGGHPRPVAGG